VVNACLDQLRRKAARPTVSADDEATLDALGQRRGGPAPGPAPARGPPPRGGAGRQRPPARARGGPVVGGSVRGSGGAAAGRGGRAKSRGARGRAKLLPYLAHLRDAETPPRDTVRNQTTTEYVSPSQGVPPPQGAQPTPAAARPGGLLASQGHPAPPADQRSA